VQPPLLVVAHSRLERRRARAIVNRVMGPCKSNATVAALVAAAALAAACASKGEAAPPIASEGFSSPDAGSVEFGRDDSGGPAPTSGDGSVALPANFVATELGGYALGPPIMTGGTDAGVVENADGTGGCSLVTAVVRDFKDKSDGNGTGDPDFDAFLGYGPTTGLVERALGSDLKPVFAGNCAEGPTVNAPCPYGQMLTTRAGFDQWYRYAPGVNLPFLVYLAFVPNGGVYTFDSEGYFPLDNAGWGNNATGDDGKPHNFGFTTEVHLSFVYKGGETFTFVGDDDVWAFIDHTLAVDLGGIHTAATSSVSLDSLGLTKGSSYALDIFNAERHPTGSHFRVDTNLSFTSCGTVPPDVPR
jgi:fibro-slime domain-containing protein